METQRKICLCVSESLCPEYKLALYRKITSNFGFPIPSQLPGKDNPYVRTNFTLTKVNSHPDRDFCATTQNSAFFVKNRMA